MSLFTIGVAQNHPPSANKPPDETLFFTIPEQEALVDEFGENKHPEVYVVDEHAGAEKTMADAPKSYLEAVATGQTDMSFAIPPEARIGRVVELLSYKGNLIPVMEHFHENPRTPEIVEDIRSGKKKYGLSVGVDTTRSFGKVHQKRLTHMGFTVDPEFGDPNTTRDREHPDLPGTWLYDAALTPDSMDKILATKYLNRPGMYASKRTRARLQKYLQLPLPPPPSPTLQQTIVASREVSDSTPLMGSTPAPLETPIPLPSRTPPSFMADQQQQQQQQQAPPPQQQQQQQQVPSPEEEALRKKSAALQSLHRTIAEAKSFIPKMRQGETNDMTQSIFLHDKLMREMIEAGVYGTPAMPREASPLMTKLLGFAESEKGGLYDTLKTLHPNNEKNIDFMGKLIEADPVQFGPIVETIAASGKMAVNFRQAELNLAKEVAEKNQLKEEFEKGQKRMRELEEENASYKKGRFDNDRYPVNQHQHQQQQPPQQSSLRGPDPAQSGAQETVMHQTIVASRFGGSTTLKPTDHKPDAYWNDLRISKAAWNASPFAKIGYNAVEDNDITRIARFAQQYASSRDMTAETEWNPNA